MTNIFESVLQMSLTGSVLALAVMVLRIALRKAPKRLLCLLWALVALRLVCPFSIESSLSLVPKPIADGQIISEITDYSEPDAYFQSLPDDYVQTIPPDPESVFHVYPIQERPTPMDTFSKIWTAGAALMLFYAIGSYLFLRRRMEEATRLHSIVWQSERTDSPFVLGLFRPRIYLPYTILPADLPHVIAHERTHICRGDHWWKPLGYCILSVHWFNPVLWLSYILLCRDIESACDEAVIASMKKPERQAYSTALLNCSIRKNYIAACPVAFGEVGVKERVKRVMNYRKSGFWMITTAIILCVVVAVCFMTDPLYFGSVPSVLEYKNAIPIVNSAGEIQVIHCPPSEEVSNGSILIGRAYGSALADQFANWEWKPCDTPEKSLPSSGSVAFIISNDYQITVHQRQKGALLSYAVVQYRDELQFYIAEANDYSEAVELVHAHGNIDSILKAKILEIHDDYFIVEPVPGSWELFCADRIQIPMKNMSPSPEPEVGDILEIAYDGQILETMPAKIIRVYSISVMSETQYTPLGVSSENVKELSRLSDEITWQDSVGFSELAPGEEIVSENAIIVEEDNSSMILSITWGRASLVLEYGIRSDDGKTHFQEKQGGSSILRITDIPAGTYHLYVRNSEAYSGIPSYERPEEFPDVSFEATGALLCSVED